jgi:hypothetical protein
MIDNCLRQGALNTSNTSRQTKSGAEANRNRSTTHYGRVNRSVQVYWTDFTPGHLRSDAFIGYLKSWKDRVLACERNGLVSLVNGETDLSKISIAQLCGQLTVPQVWAAISAVLGLSRRNRDNRVSCWPRSVALAVIPMAE